MSNRNNQGRSSRQQPVSRRIRDDASHAKKNTPTSSYKGKSSGTTGRNLEQKPVSRRIRGDEPQSNNDTRTAAPRRARTNENLRGAEQKNTPYRGREASQTNSRDGRVAPRTKSTENVRGTESTERVYNFVPKAKVAKAKKMVVRHLNQETQLKADRLKIKRTHLENMESVRLQKALAASGVGSRREMEEWISQGAVTVNGKVASLGDKVSPHDRVSVKGSFIKLKWPDRLPRIIVYNKNEGEIVSRDDPKGRVSVFDKVAVAKSSRWVAIGRLDVNTMGMLILTTSGELANRFAHPSYEVEREYSVRVLGTLETEKMRELTTTGIQLEDGLAKFQSIQEAGGEGVNHWYKVVLKEGRNREVRRIFEHLGLTVSRLIRTRFGPIALPSRLKRGQFYELNELEVAKVVRWADMSMPGDNNKPFSRKP